MNKNINPQSTILITGAAGFIGSCMASFLNKQGFNQLILCDDFTQKDKTKNHEQIQCIAHIERDELENNLNGEIYIDVVIHFGARTDTTEMDYSIHKKLNLDFSKMIWKYCSKKQVTLIYASSAATYGNGEYGYEDDENSIEKLQPLNPYGVSKNEFDKWALTQIKEKKACPPKWYGLKFFNVYGPNEYHKGRMASVIFHAYHQIKDTGKMILFRSHHPEYKDGEQKRDFIYVKDILNVTSWLMNHLPKNGLYNLGTGHAETFISLAKAIFKSLDLDSEITFKDTPVDIRDKYQYFTEANMHKLRKAGYTADFYNIETGISDYVKHYLLPEKYF